MVTSFSFSVVVTFVFITDTFLTFSSYMVAQQYKLTHLFLMKVSRFHQREMNECTVHLECSVTLTETAGNCMHVDGVGAC